MEYRKLILRYLDGKVIPALVGFFENGTDPIAAIKPDGTPICVNVSELKAAFFVRDYLGNPSYQSLLDEEELRKRTSGVFVRLFFKDGEMMMGQVANGTDFSKGFFVKVLDPDDNNILVYVNPLSLSKPPEIG
ncbi:MAG: hypothetical protein ACE14Q_02575 [Acidobacteriota bacterium]